MADDRLPGKARDVLAASEQLDDREREIGEAQRIGRAPLQQEGVQRGRVGLAGQLRRRTRAASSTIRCQRSGERTTRRKTGNPLRFEEARDDRRWRRS